MIRVTITVAALAEVDEDVRTRYAAEPEKIANFSPLESMARTGR